MELSLGSVALAFGAGLASVLSPCVLPVVPIVVTGTEQDSRWRPVTIVGGLALTFMLMGVATSLAGAWVAGFMGWVEKLAGATILVVGVLMLADINVFKRLSFLGSLGGSGARAGLLGGFAVGLSLGIVWIPCVGPMLSGVLALVATEGRLASGVLLLLVYSLGFAVPMLVAAYASQWFRTRVRAVQRFPLAVRLLSGGLLAVFGLWILVRGPVIVT